MLWCLLASSLVTFAILAGAAIDENYGADWYGHQSEYKRALIARATSESQIQAAERFGVQPRQLFLPELQRIDRCVTCHVAIDDPGMKDAPQPLTTHPGNIMLNHSKERFGCTICHKGQGRATTAADAHGHVPHWPSPMLPPEKYDLVCFKCHADPELEDAPNYNFGMKLFLAKSCRSCHRLRGNGNDIAPDISRAGATHDMKWHVKHFMDPRSVVATSAMPDLKLSRKEAEALAFLMMSLDGQDLSAGLISQKKPKPKKLDATLIDPKALKGLMGSKVCVGCHENVTPEAVEGWKTSKMTSTYERIRNDPDRDKCLACHATGFNPATGHFSEEGVGCEACHGPGKEAVRLILANKLEEHKKAMALNKDSKLVCVKCHKPHLKKGTHMAEYRR
ncbi:MAG: cbb3-type cytochrome c oxidase subunit II [Planctomycetota bacterium]